MVHPPANKLSHNKSEVTKRKKKEKQTYFKKLRIKEAASQPISDKSLLPCAAANRPGTPTWQLLTGQLAWAPERDRAPVGYTNLIPIQILHKYIYLTCL